ALDADGAVVALETTLVAHGFPPGEGLEVGLESERQVRAAGAVPATVGVLDGEVHIGLSEEELGRFGPFARKVGPRDLAAAAVHRAGDSSGDETPTPRHPAPRRRPRAPARPRGGRAAGGGRPPGGGAARPRRRGGGARPPPDPLHPHPPHLSAHRQPPPPP